MLIAQTLIFARLCCCTNGDGVATTKALTRIWHPLIICIAPSFLITMTNSIRRLHSLQMAPLHKQATQLSYKRAAAKHLVQTSHQSQRAARLRMFDRFLVPLFRSLHVLRQPLLFPFYLRHFRSKTRKARKTRKMGKLGAVTRRAHNRCQDESRPCRLQRVTVWVSPCHRLAPLSRGALFLARLLVPFPDLRFRLQ